MKGIDLPPTIRLTKLDVARYQLRTAIELWFLDGDPVSVHTLAFASYEIVHVLSKKRNKFRPTLLFDSDIIKDELRKEWNLAIKEAATFFKHADRDPESSIDFQPEESAFYMQFAIRGLTFCGVAPGPHESAFMIYRGLQRPSLLSAKGRELFVDQFPTEEIEEFSSLPKRDFFRAFLANYQSLRRGHTP